MTPEFQSTLPAKGATGRDGHETRVKQHISIHAPREGSDGLFNGRVRDVVISIHAPREGSDKCTRDSNFTGMISIHAPREGSDLRQAGRGGWQPISIHAPREGSDTRQRPRIRWTAHFNPRSPRRERRPGRKEAAHDARISIHAPREGSDWSRRPRNAGQATYFNPRSPRRERPAGELVEVGTTEFQSTLPAKGATQQRERCRARLGDFNPRSPRRERPAAWTRRPWGCYFNPRSPRRERLKNSTRNRIAIRFQSTLPAKGATPFRSTRDVFGNISIHAPREGSDRRKRRDGASTRYFNPRSPRRERPPFVVKPAYWHDHFNPRSPRRERLQDRRRGQRQGRISIHAPREGSDIKTADKVAALVISIHAPREGSDMVYTSRSVLTEISIHAPREGSDFGWRSTPTRSRRFQSTLPAKGATSRRRRLRLRDHISIHAPREGSDR